MTSIARLNDIDANGRQLSPQLHTVGIIHLQAGNSCSANVGQPNYTKFK
jgi:hypothetical protein